MVCLGLLFLTEPEKEEMKMAKWYEEAVFYHMYPIGMTGAPRVNKDEGVVHRFAELEKWLPHLADIKATAIYIGPLFESTTHGYDTRDYKLVDQRLGDNEDFARFVEKAHQMGIKVVVDGVFNHTGREFFAFGISRRTGKAPGTADGTRESISDGTIPTMTDFPMRHGETALSLSI